jgi:hypothetical protein
MKNIKIQIPTNHEIDQEKSDLSKGLVCFKEVKKQLPTRWEGKDLTKEAEKIDCYKRIISNSDPKQVQKVKDEILLIKAEKEAEKRYPANEPDFAMFTASKYEKQEAFLQGVKWCREQLKTKT